MVIGLLLLAHARRKGWLARPVGSLRSRRGA
jgi:hypothetical protein